ncbi:MAG: AsmA-like C-terminal domain-containing protein, partial [Planctomycetes bacterium]|nr:AsmA-like C-terminal domain-containing protein [Planctomycetota bacterium]
RFVLDGKIDRQRERTPGRFRIDIRNLLLDKRLYQRLPVPLQKYYTMLQPSGTVDLKGMLDFDGVKTWTPHNFVLTAKGCSVNHVKFPYKVQDILGEVVQRGNHLVFNMGGHVGRRPVRISGRIINPGPEAESEFVFQVERLPIDDAFLAACNERTRKTLELLNLQGSANVEYRYHRPPGLNQNPKFEIIADLQNCSMECALFKYRLTNLTGTVTHSSGDGSWAFHELRANHGSATVTGSGSFIQFADVGRLELNLSATNAQFEPELKQALPVALQKVWEDFQPIGKLNVNDILIHWIPGRPVEITLPSIEISDASFEMRAFPLPIQNVRAKLSYKRMKKTGTEIVTIHSFSGMHDETVIRAKGFSTFAPNGDWRVRLTKLNVDDLISTRKFRVALPEELRSVFQELNLQRPISFSGMMEFKGTNNPADPVTAAWDLQTILTGNSLTTGIDLEQASGEIEMWGTWDGKRVLMDGSINLDSVHIWDHQFTQVRGPFRLEDTRLTVGTPEAFRQKSQTFNPASIPRKDRLTARAIGGIITLDADVPLQEETSYRVKMTLNGGRLDEYAKRYLPGVTSLAGIMTGEIDLIGKGTSSDQIIGRGWLQISSAALYELPVMLKIFNLISLGPAEKSAFTYALLNFSIGNERFHFNTIDLVGNTINFYGKGTATFDGDLDLEFASELPPNLTPSIPFISHVVRGATRNWVGIFVTGTVNSPKAESRPIPQLDEALKKVFGVFEPRPVTPPPRRIFRQFPSFRRRPSSHSSPQGRNPRSR